MKRPYICGDGRRFATQEEAINHAGAVYRARGVVISVEREMEAEL